MSDPKDVEMPLAVIQGINKRKRAAGPVDVAPLEVIQDVHKQVDPREGKAGIPENLSKEPIAAKAGKPKDEAPARKPRRPAAKTRQKKVERYTSVITIRVTDEVADALEEVADDNDWKSGHLARKIITGWVKEKKKRYL